MIKKCINCDKVFVANPEHVKLCNDCDTWYRRWIEAAKNLFDHHPNYSEYIQSDAWRKRADEAKRRAGHRCQVCNCQDNLEAHHRTYERLGRERPDDITVLCTKCHRKFHNV